MSEIKRLGENLSYLDRFITDMRAIESSLQSNHRDMSYEEACRDIFNNIRSLSVSEIESLKEINIESAQAVQDFSNNILKLVSRLMNQEVERQKANQVKLSLMSDIISTTASSREELSSQIENAKTRAAIEVPEPVLATPPPVRKSNTGKALRNVGERPPQVRKVGERPK